MNDIKNIEYFISAVKYSRKEEGEKIFQQVKIHHNDDGKIGEGKDSTRGNIIDLIRGYWAEPKTIYSIIFKNDQYEIGKEIIVFAIKNRHYYLRTDDKKIEEDYIEGVIEY
jgi:hypothetical protein